MLLLVQAGALFLLLIGGVNLVNLLLIRATGAIERARRPSGDRRQPSRIARQVVVETTLLALAGAVCGLVLGAAGIRLLETLGTDHAPPRLHDAFNAPLALAGIAAAIVLAVLLALPVAWFTLRSPAVASLATESRSSTASAGVQRLRHAFSSGRSRSPLRCSLARASSR